MTQEDKELLLKDLCARLPYKVKCKDVTLDFTGIMTDISMHDNMCKLYNDYGDNYTCYMMNCKPYLFPFLSMTDEQIHEFYCRFIENDISFEDFVADYWDINSFHKLLTSMDDCRRVVEWFNENHCDYRGLIPMGLALDATRLNIY